VYIFTHIVVVVILFIDISNKKPLHPRQFQKNFKKKWMYISI